jgi:hypothetical protein
MAQEGFKRSNFCRACHSIPLPALLLPPLPRCHGWQTMSLLQILGVVCNLDLTLTFDRSHRPACHLQIWGRCLLSDCFCVLSICRTVRIHRVAFPSCSSPREIYIRRSHASHSTFPTSVIALGHHARSPIHPRRLHNYPPRGGHGRAYHCAHSPWTCVTVLPLSLLQLDGARARRAHLRGIPSQSSLSLSWRCASFCDDGALRHGRPKA